MIIGSKVDTGVYNGFREKGRAKGLGMKEEVMMRTDGQKRTFLFGDSRISNFNEESHGKDVEIIFGSIFGTYLEITRPRICEANVFNIST